MKILLITPPLLQPNTPYAATPLLTAWLTSIGHDAVQADLSLELLLRLCSREGLMQLARDAEYDLEFMQAYVERIEEVVAFLQDKDPSAAVRIAERGYLPEGPAVQHAYDLEEQLQWNFRGTDLYDRARHLASLYLDDIADLATQLDPNFGFSRYAEKLGVSLPAFGPLKEELESADTLLSSWLRELTDQVLSRHAPEMVALTVPFPGCLLGALLIARRIRETDPQVHITLGGGFVNTELRELRDPGIFEFVDSISLDSGFVPLQRLAESNDPADWVRTYSCEAGNVVFHNAPAPDLAHNTLPPPDYSGLRLDRYFGLFEVLNPVTRLWTDGRWNKLTLAHGCCWSRCAFCDTSIEYIGRYDPADAATICGWISEVVQQTGFNGFHFVDEALPPDLLDRLCDEILRRGLQIEWWGNIRFEKRFSAGLIEKMAAAGCIAVTGGLETCSDRTLRLMRKGIVLRHATRVLENLAAAGIMTHAYLMYGFPTQTRAETFEALERVRALFERGVLHSAFWHRFALTAHSPISEHPEDYGIELVEPVRHRFALNEVPFRFEFDHDLTAVGEIVRAATYNYQLGVGTDLPIRHWQEHAGIG